MPNSARLPFGAILAEQLRVAAPSLVRETAFVPVLLAALAAFMIVQFAVGGDTFSVALEPAHLLAALPLAVLLPHSIWKADPPFGRAFLWTLPVSRQRSILARVTAGGLCLVLALLLLFAVAGALGGGFGGAEPWQWAAPFTASLVVYVFASAAIVGIKHRMRWAAGLFGFWCVLALLVGTLPQPTVARVTGGVLAFWSGRFGPDHVLTGGPSGAAHWIEATLIWGAAAFLALALAIRRHREG
jgi:hypothetical protein